MVTVECWIVMWTWITLSTFLSFFSCYFTYFLLLKIFFVGVADCILWSEWYLFLHTKFFSQIQLFEISTSYVWDGSLKLAKFLLIFWIILSCFWPIQWITKVYISWPIVCYCCFCFWFCCYCMEFKLYFLTTVGIWMQRGLLQGCWIPGNRRKAWEHWGVFETVRVLHETVWGSDSGL